MVIYSCIYSSLGVMVFLKKRKWVVIYLFINVSCTVFFVARGVVVDCLVLWFNILLVLRSVTPK